MLFKFNVSNVVITNTYAQKDVTESTTVKIDSINLEQEVKPEEIKELVNGITTMVKEFITTSKNNNTSNKRYHIVKVMKSYFIEDTYDKKYYTINSSNNKKEVTKDNFDSKIHRVKKDMEEGYFTENDIHDYYSDTLPVAE